MKIYKAKNNETCQNCLKKAWVIIEMTYMKILVCEECLKELKEVVDLPIIK